jgi:hypothetical protein
MENAEPESLNQKLDELNIDSEEKCKNQLTWKIIKIFAFQLCCYIWLIINAFIIFITTWGAINMQCKGPPHICYYINSDYPDFCTVFIPLPNHNITCDCPPGDNQGSFECYVPDDPKYCFVYDCSEYPRHKLGFPAFISGIIIGAFSIGIHILSCTNFSEWIYSKYYKKR